MERGEAFAGNGECPGWPPQARRLVDLPAGIVLDGPYLPLVSSHAKGHTVVWRRPLCSIDPQFRELDIGKTFLPIANVRVVQ